MAGQLRHRAGILKPMPACSRIADPLTVNCSPTAKSLPIRAGLRHGLFLQHDIALQLVSNENSRAQRDGLARGDFQIVHVAIDNAVSMRDVDGLDIVVFMGGDSGMNELFVQPGIESVGGIRGGRLVVDAPDTAFALQAYRILADAGLQRGTDYAVVPVGRGALRLEALLADPDNTAAILNLPYSLDARRAGLKSLGDTTDFIGAYQAGSAFAMRAWAETHRDLVVRYIRAYLACLRHVLDPANHDDCAAILVEEIDAAPAVASDSVALLRRPGFGLEPLARIDQAGLRNTLALRDMLAGPKTGDPGRYVDPSYHADACADRSPFHTGGAGPERR